ncbi:MAG: ASKHA domain-containing protein [Rhodospirillales bacterium]|nr:ASKHA domain-containing protein [Rhodospirillales bacterium]
MPKISQQDYQKRLDRLTEIFSDIVSHADAQATHRCPYRDARDRCTAAFSCGNQIAAAEKGEPATCGHDGTFDYSLAWEADPATLERARKQLDRVKRSAAARREGKPLPTGPGTVSHDGRTEPLAVGMTLFDCADELAVEVPTSCLRNGRCHECVVEVSAGEDALCARTEAEGFLRPPYRLACQALVERDDIDVAFAPLRRRPRILVRAHADAAASPAAFDPLVTRRGDEVLYDGAVVDRYREHMLGLAVDLGTTTVVLDFVDLETGKSVHSAAFENPQAFGGSDVMNRISYDRDDKAGELQKAAASAISRAIVDGCARLGLGRETIYEIVVAANPTMRDILFKLDVQGIGQKPYKSSIEHAFLAGERANTALSALARRLGLRANREARVYGLPLIASHVGGDAAAALVALEQGFAEAETVMLVDMGTNTEVVVKHGGRMLAASCPAGPAFEGGLVRYGMPACDGAIETVRLGADGEAAYETIGGKQPLGLCGSGLIDLLAALRRGDVLTAKGVFTADRKQKDMTVVPEHGITFSKEDASNLGQAKAANYCGQYIVMRALGVGPAEVERLYLAGGFANYVNVRNAQSIGLLAPVPEKRVVKAGNAAARGARAILLSGTRRRALEREVQAIDHIELETTPDFFDLFVDGCQFKPMPAHLVPEGTAA